MIYLTNMFMKLDAREGRRDIGNCHHLHRTIMGAFPNLESDTARKEQNILFRVMADGGLRARIFVQATTKPDIAVWEGLPHLVVERRNSSGYLEIAEPRKIFWEGRLLRYDLLACPTKKVGGTTKEQRLHGERKNSRRVGLIDRDSRLLWLGEKAAEGGFSILSSSEDGKQMITGTKPSGHRITHAGIRFTGVLRVENSQEFVKTMMKGIGAGKAHGLGLLMVSEYNRC